MQTLDKTLDSLQQSANPPSPAPAVPPPNAPLPSKENSLKLEAALARFWEKMGEIYGAKWVNQWGSVADPAFGTWLKVLGDLKPGHIRSGFETLCRVRPDFLPDALEFRKLCLGITGLPEVREAYVEAANARRPYDKQQYSHPIVYHAGKACGFTYLASYPEKVALPRFTAFFNLLVKRIENGEVLEAPTPELLEHKPAPYDPDQHRAGLERFCKTMQDLGIKDPPKPPTENHHASS
jgi:hypothetical protein